MLGSATKGAGRPTDQNVDRARSSGTVTVNRDALSHTERKLRESITDAYRVLSDLAEVETVVMATLADARRVYGDVAVTSDEGDRLAEAVYCHQSSVARAVTHTLLLAPASVERRFERIIERPRRLDDRLPEPARAIAYGGYPVSEWVVELLELADLLEAYHDALTVSVDRLADVEAYLPAYVTGERAFRPSATAVLA